MRRSFLDRTRRRERLKQLTSPLLWQMASALSKAALYILCGDGSRINLPWDNNCVNTASGSVIGRNSVDDGQQSNMKRQTIGDGGMANLNGKVGMETGGG